MRCFKIRLTLLFVMFILMTNVKSRGVTKQVTLAYSANDFTIMDDSGTISIIPHDVYATFDTDTLAPALPLYTINVLIAPTQSFDSISFSQVQTLFRDNIYVRPNASVVPTSDTICSNYGLRQYVNYCQDIYPSVGHEVEYIGTYTMDGYKYLSFIVCPLKYDAINNSLYLRTSIILNIHLNEQQFAPGVVVSPIIQNGGTNMRDAVQSLVHNPSEINLLYPSNQINIPSNSSNYRYDYIIVTADSLKQFFMPLVEWKTMKGIKTGILSIEDIQQNYPLSPNEYRGTHSPLPLQIKYALKDYYDGTYCGLKYVLLGGDLNIIPVDSCYAKFGEWSTLVPADYFYSSFSTMNWDTNNNDIIADISDEIDYTPNIIISRFPVSNANEVQVQVDKYIKYEKSPFSFKWKHSMLLGGSKVYFYDNGISDAHFFADSFLYPNCIQPYWNGNKYNFFDTGTDFDGGAAYDFTKDNLHSQLSNGYMLTNIDTHGGNTGWVMEESLKYDYNKASSLINRTPMVILTSSCWTNNIEVNNCLSRGFFMNPNANIMYYIGSNRYGWASKSKSHIGASLRLNGIVLNNLFRDNTQNIAKSLMLAKATNIDAYYYDSPNRWLLFSVNILGDPETSVYLNYPQRISNINIDYYTNGSFSYSSSTDSCDLCVMSLSDMGETYYERVYNANSLSSNNIPLYSNLCITKPGFAPFCLPLETNLHIHDNMFLQNLSLSDDNRYVSNNVLIGSDVTNEQQEGPVSIRSGSTLINSHNGVFIKNNFTVLRGAEFKITN